MRIAKWRRPSGIGATFRDGRLPPAALSFTMIFIHVDRSGSPSPNRQSYRPASFAVRRIHADRHPHGDHRADPAALHLAMVPERLASRAFLYGAICGGPVWRVDHHGTHCLARLPARVGAWLSTYRGGFGAAECADARAGTGGHGCV